MIPALVQAAPEAASPLPTLIPTVLNTLSNESVVTAVNANIFRPDGRNSIETSASYLLGDGLSLGLSRYNYSNPNVSNTQVRARLILDESSQTAATAGLAVTDNGTVPELGISTVLLDNDTQKLKLFFDRGLTTSDPRAVEALIQHNTVGIAFDSGAVDSKYQLSFNSDGTEVHEGWISIPLTDDDFITLRSYLRAASEESSFFWSPQFFSNTGVLVGFPLVTEDDYNVQIGVQPGFSYSTNRDGGSNLSLTAPVGVRAQYTPDDQLRIMAKAGYSHGLTVDLSLDWSF